LFDTLQATKIKGIRAILAYASGVTRIGAMSRAGAPEVRLSLPMPYDLAEAQKRAGAIRVRRAL
jgi:hypothetical protein